MVIIGKTPMQLSGKRVSGGAARWRSPVTGVISAERVGAVGVTKLTGLQFGKSTWLELELELKRTLEDYGPRCAYFLNGDGRPRRRAGHSGAANANA
jgi:hypothetical protein